MKKGVNLDTLEIEIDFKCPNCGDDITYGYELTNCVILPDHECSNCGQGIRVDIFVSSIKKEVVYTKELLSKIGPD